VTAIPPIRQTRWRENEVGRDRRPRPFAEPKAEPSPELQRILRDLQSPDDQTRADAVRTLCPCRGIAWETPVFPEVLALRDDPSPLVSGAVRHDLQENPEWGERQESRKLEGRRRRREWEQVQAEIQDGGEESDAPAAHSLAWRMPRRPRCRKWHYAAGREAPRRKS
jgi:hypothetical protein